MKLSKVKLYVILNIFSAIVALALNYLSISIPLNGKTTGELSDLYANYFVPAGFTFSIWGIIYLMMIAFIVFQLYQIRKKDLDTIEIIIVIGPWFFISCLANAAWIIFWHYEYVFLSVSIMLILLTSLLQIYFALKSFGPLTTKDNIFVLTFFSIYTGWISVATIANVTAALVSIGWNGGVISPQYWACIMIVVASFFGVIFVYRNKDIPYTIVIIWALWGIYSKQISISENMSQTVALFAKYGGTMLLIYSLFSIFGKNTYFHLVRKDKSLA